MGGKRGHGLKVATRRYDIAPPAQSCPGRKRHSHDVIRTRNRVAERMQAAARIDHRLVPVGKATPLLPADEVTTPGRTTPLPTASAPLSPPPAAPARPRCSPVKAHARGATP